MDNDSPGPALFTSTPIKNRSIGLNTETSSSPFKRQRMTAVSYGRGEFSTPSDDCIIFDDSFSSCSSPENKQLYSPVVARLLDESRSSELEELSYSPVVARLLDESSESEIETTPQKQQHVRLLDETESSIDSFADCLNPPILLDNDKESRVSSLDATIQPTTVDTTVIQRSEAQEDDEVLSGVFSFSSNASDISNHEFAEEVYSLLDDSIDANTSNADSEDEKPRSLPQSWVDQADNNCDGLDKPKDLKLRTDEDLLWILTIKCCSNKCMRSLSIEDLDYAQVNLKERTQTERRNYLLDFIQSHSKLNDSGEFETEFMIRGKIVCKEAWLLACNVSRSSFSRVAKQYKDGVVVVQHGNKGKKGIMAKTADCIAWLQFFIGSIGDNQPDSKTIHLPSCFSGVDIYKKMKDENTRFGLPTISLSHFYRLWEQHFSHVLIPKENRFTKCNDCTQYKREKEGTMDKGQRARIDQLLNAHLELVWQERRVYYLHRYKARKFPSKYLTSINDGMDQHTTNIPNLRRISKSMAGLRMVGTHLVGSIIHSGQVSEGKAFYGSFDYYQFPHDSNLTISILLDVLVKWTEDQHKLPPVLYLQFDNCVRENKNQFMFTLLAILVHLKVFKKIRVNFLPVGHTHEDIDAFFGVFSKHLAKLDVYTMDDLQRALESCVSHTIPQAFSLTKVYDIRTWLNGYGADLHEHTFPKCFKLEANENAVVEMFYRNWSHYKWKGPVVLIERVPPGKPDLVKPTLKKLDFERLKTDIPKYEGNIPQSASTTWTNWLNRIDELLEVPKEYNWPVEELCKAERTVPQPVSEKVPQDLEELRDRETQETREIYTGRYRRPEERAAPVALVEGNFLEGIAVGAFVAMYFANSNEIPCLGKVLKLETDHFEVHYYKGTYNGRWTPRHVPRKRATPWTERLAKTCIVWWGQLVDGMKLEKATRTFLKERYDYLISH
ncbi:uncharacterized protein LOC5517433 [Nematostella vectensis]|uniref:uncharacterized protein LOC5517433 n=1 Tax=Nematostella vectensis TaxID=45351 RepID=UPI00138FA9CE|nr:uncharacterized protein LOC5517433 [Nematostella vectensis]